MSTDIRIVNDSITDKPVKVKNSGKRKYGRIKGKGLIARLKDQVTQLEKEREDLESYLESR
jgi:hypothetical protein